jgi:hypothetical protein
MIATSHPEAAIRVHTSLTRGYTSIHALLSDCGSSCVLCCSAYYHCQAYHAYIPILALLLLPLRNKRLQYCILSEP